MELVFVLRDAMIEKGWDVRDANALSGSITSFVYFSDCLFDWYGNGKYDPKYLDDPLINELVFLILSAVGPIQPSWMLERGELASMRFWAAAFVLYEAAFAQDPTVADRWYLPDRRWYLPDRV